MNDDALLYSHSSESQILDASYFLDKYLKLLKEKNDARVMDVGCAEGTVSFKVLLPRLPTNFKKLCLLDVEENLINFAKKQCESDKIEFVVMDIATKTIPQDMRQKYDRIFSFNTLNWVVEEKRYVTDKHTTTAIMHFRHQQAMKNCFDMLEPNGDIFFTIVSSHACYDIWENMAKTKKWACFAEKIDKVVSIYHHLEDPEKKLRSFLEEAGFDVHLCRVQERYCVYSSWSHFENFALAVNPFIKLVSEKERDSFIQNHREEIRRHKLIRPLVGADGKERVQEYHKILVACASKIKKV